LAVAVYAVTALFPREERFGLTSQLRRAATSAPSNIAEGCGRGTDADFRRFLRIAVGSACELEYHLQLARDLDLLTVESHTALSATCIEVKRMLSSLIKRLADS